MSLNKNITSHHITLKNAQYMLCFIGIYKTEIPYHIFIHLPLCARGVLSCQVKSFNSGRIIAAKP